MSVARSRPSVLRSASFGLTTLLVFGGCSLFLDFDELQGGATGGVGGETAGAGGSAASGGSGGGGGSTTAGGGGAGAQSGSGGTAGTAGSGGTVGGSGGASDAGPDTGASVGLALADVAAALGDAACRALDACAGPAKEIALLGEDCVSLFTRVFGDSYVASVTDSVTAGRITYDPALGGQCVQNLLDAAAADPPDCTRFYPIIEDCKAALGGLGGVGDACRHDFECQRGFGCDLGASCPGTCAPLGSVSDVCIDDTDCDPNLGLYCRAVEQDGGPNVSVCTEYLALGDACTLGGVECALGGFCANGQCRRITDVFTAAEGFPCWGASGTLCQEGLSCEFSGLPLLSAATCQQELAPLDSCAFALPDRCPDGHYCSAGTCLALPGLNQPCAKALQQSLGIAPACGPELACVDGICKQRERIGDACEADHQCYSGSCAGPDGGVGVCERAGCQ